MDLAAVADGWGLEADEDAELAVDVATMRMRGGERR
jgi:hypothetical protein